MEEKDMVVQYEIEKYPDLHRDEYTGDTGLEDIGAEDLIIPRVSIGQEKTPNINSEEIGKYRNNVTGTAVESMDVISILFKKTRLMMPEDYDPDNKPMCGSVDFTTPSGVFLQTAGFDVPCEDCTKCPYAKWTKKSNGKPKPPRCNEIWNFLTLDKSFDIFWQSYKSTALKGVRKYVSALSMQMKIQKVGRMWAFSTHQSIVESSSNEGIYIPSFGKPELLSRDMLAAADQVREEMKDTPVQVDMRHDVGETETGEEF